LKGQAIREPKPGLQRRPTSFYHLRSPGRPFGEKLPLPRAHLIEGDLPATMTKKRAKHADVKAVPYTSLTCLLISGAGGLTANCAFALRFLFCVGEVPNLAAPFSRRR